MSKTINVMVGTNKISGKHYSGKETTKTNFKNDKSLNPNDEFVVKIGIEKTFRGNKEYSLIKAWHNEEQWTETLSNSFCIYLDEAGGFLDGIAIPAGFTIRSKLMYRKVWKEADVPTFNIKLFFKSYNNAYDDVFEPIRRLQLCFVVSEMNARNRNTELSLGNAIKNGLTSLLLVPPGPPLISGGFLDTIRSNHEIHSIKFIKISNFVTLNNILPTSMEVNWNIKEKEYYKKGKEIITLPSSAEVSISFEAVEIWTNYEIYKLFDKYSDAGDDSKQVAIDLNEIGNMIKNLFVSANEYKEMKEKEN